MKTVAVTLIKSCLQRRRNSVTTRMPHLRLDERWLRSIRRRSRSGESWMTERERLTHSWQWARSIVFWICLTQILARAGKPGLWQIQLSFPTSTAWVIIEPNDPRDLSFSSKNLSLCLGGSPCIIAGVQQQQPPPVGTFLLGGSIVASQNDTIVNVATVLLRAQ